MVTGKSLGFLADFAFFLTVVSTISPKDMIGMGQS